jgi:hypothetical protein
LQELVQLQQQELQRLQQHNLEAQQQQPLQHSGLRDGSGAGRYLGSAAWQGVAGSAQLEAATLRQQLQGTTSRLQDMEAAMARLLDQQVRTRQAQQHWA